MFENDQELPEAPQETPSGSMMDQLREQHRKLAEAATTEIPVPGYNGLLVARYRILDVQNELKKLSARINREFKDPVEQALYSTIDAMVLSCVELLYDDGETLRPLSESFGPDSAPVRYDQRLAEFLALTLEDETARSVVRGTFGNNEPAIFNHGGLLSRWMTGANQGAMNSFMEAM